MDKELQRKFMNHITNTVTDETMQQAYKNMLDTQFIHPLWCVTPEGTVCIMLYGGETRARAQKLARDKYNFVRGHRMFERVVLMEEHPIDVARQMQRAIRWMPKKKARKFYEKNFRPKWNRT